MIQTVEVGTLFNVALILLVVTLIAVLVRLFRNPLSNIAQTLNPFYLAKRLRNLSERVNELESSSFEDRMNTKDVYRSLKKINKRNKTQTKRKRS